MLWRIRATSFLAGVAVAGSAALYQLRQDIWDSHAILAAQVSQQSTTTEPLWNRWDQAPPSRCSDAWVWLGIFLPS